MRDLYAKVGERLGAVAFDRIYKGFSPFDFALYNSDNVYLSNTVIPYDRRFVGSTCIEYEGRWIAIWAVDQPGVEDPETLAANMVHEMFHAFQRANGESRYPSDLRMLDYPDNAENFMAKYCENQLLADAFLSGDATEARELLARFAASRRYREGLIGDYIDQEYRAETIEGMAEYAGCMALKQLSAEKYARKIEGMISALETLDGLLFDARRISYYTGALFCITLAQAGIDFHHAIGAAERPLFRLAAIEAEAAKPSIDINEALFSAEMQQYFADKQRQFDDFLSGNTKRTARDAAICGYDPMNMIKIGRDILCRHFIMLKGREDAEPLFIEGPVMVTLKSGSLDEVESYTQRLDA